jgi:hypothetical protein
MPVSPPDFPCLLPLGFHALTLEAVEEQCVKEVPAF